jgi:hypothetical protein
MMLTALHTNLPPTTTTTSYKDSYIPPIYDPFDNANAWGSNNNNGTNDEIDLGNTHRLLEAIEQQKKVVEVELTRLKEQATGSA